MQLSHDVVINKPVQTGWDYANNPDNLIHWLNDFVSHERVKGDIDAPGVGPARR